MDHHLILLRTAFFSSQNLTHINGYWKNTAKIQAFILWVWWESTRLLAHQLRQSSASNVISEIKTQYGVTILCFKTTIYHYILYLWTKLHPPWDEAVFYRYYSPPDWPSHHAISRQSNNCWRGCNGYICLTNQQKPWPAGFPVEFYKAFSAEFHMYNESFELGNLPKILCETSVTLLLKKNKDPLVLWLILPCVSSASRF